MKPILGSPNLFRALKYLELLEKKTAVQEITKKNIMLNI